MGGIFKGVRCRSANYGIIINELVSIQGMWASVIPILRPSWSRYRCLSYRRRHTSQRPLGGQRGTSVIPSPTPSSIPSPLSSLSLLVSPAVVTPEATTKGEGSAKPRRRRVAERRHTRPSSQPPPCTHLRGRGCPPPRLRKRLGVMHMIYL